MFHEFVLSAFASVLTGVVLWAVLPRGAALTRTMVDPDTWTIRNDSPVPVRLTSVTYQSMDTMRDGKVFWRELPIEAADEVPPERWEEPGFTGFRLAPNEEQLYYALTLPPNSRYRGFVVPPGDDLTAMVLNNRTLRIRYRRDGWTGILERREIRVHGGT